MIENIIYPSRFLIGHWNSFFKESEILTKPLLFWNLNIMQSLFLVTTLPCLIMERQSPILVVLSSAYLECFDKSVPSQFCLLLSAPTFTHISHSYSLSRHAPVFALLWPRGPRGKCPSQVTKYAGISMYICRCMAAASEIHFLGILKVLTWKWHCALQ